MSTKKRLKLSAIALFISSLSVGTALAVENVNVDNFARAESDSMIRSQLSVIGDIGKLFHMRGPIPLDQQAIIRMNMDTLYSSVILDLSEPAVISLPDGGDRYISMQVINQDHYIYGNTEAGTYTLTKESTGSRYVTVSFRVLANANDPTDIMLANQLQDQISVNTPFVGVDLELPEWDQHQLKIARDALNTLALLGLDASKGLGLKNKVDPVHHLLSTASGWGGLPVENAAYEILSVENNEADAPYQVTVNDVPVDAFWSITVYNRDGFLEANDLGVNSYNSLTAKPNDDGSITINFGDCTPDKRNCLPITNGWNYLVRMYEPQAKVISGEWRFPELTKV
ncbi:DUF1214 domain-containing protein [Aliivibrio fischeri]|uniref:DUF1214 domain-containing protein n=1 Tax=Aliivibrio fischeri TaxID=668 RepID=UPI0012D9B410|nr:DUF1214 domain-containing protein [Aliivibrio fischeri]MUL03185.1 DUF1214 domain-containing protein [Aliivibrio fischeri]